MSRVGMCGDFGGGKLAMSRVGMCGEDYSPSSRVGAGRPVSI